MLLEGQNSTQDFESRSQRFQAAGPERSALLRTGKIREVARVWEGDCSDFSGFRNLWILDFSDPRREDTKVVEKPALFAEDFGCPNGDMAAHQREAQDRVLNDAALVDDVATTLARALSLPGTNRTLGRKFISLALTAAEGHGDDDAGFCGRGDT